MSTPHTTDPMTTIKSTTVNTFKNRITTLTLTTIILLIVGSVDVYSISEFSYVDPLEGFELVGAIVITLVVAIMSVWFLIYSLRRESAKPYRVKTGEEFSDLPYDNPPVDYGGYKIDYPHCELAARNLPPTNDPDEIQERKWQMRYEQLSGNAPYSLVGPLDVGYFRQRGRIMEEWDKRREKDGDRRFGIGEFTLMVLMALVVGLLIFASCSSDS